MKKKIGRLRLTKVKTSPLNSLGFSTGKKVKEETIEHFTGPGNLMLTHSAEEY
jgi:hypothetical protein